jgi:uncharacterized delta-60 repeat protein
MITENETLMKKKLLYISTLLLLSSLVAISQDGTLDPSFDGDGVVVTDFFGDVDQSYTIIQQADGKIVSSGFSDIGENHVLSRYLLDGSLDTSFGTNGKVINDFNNEPNFIYYASIQQQADQKLVTATTHRLVSGDQDFFLVRYLENGDLDPSFGNNGTVMTDYGVDILASASLLPDGKIVAGGWSRVGSSTYVVITKYLPNGDLDTSFGVDGITTTYINDEPTIVFPLVVQTDGKFLVAFRKEETNNLQTLILHRYLTNGTLDLSFGTNGILVTNLVAGNIYGSIATKENGDIVVAMRLGPSVVILTQFTSDGTLDTSFGTNGVTNISVPYVAPVDILLDQDENILVSGNNFGFEVGDYYISRFDTNGFLDTSFGTNGTTVLDFESSALILQNDGRILVTGFTFWYSGPVDFVVVRFRNGVLGIPNKTQQKFTVYPNPSQNVFTVKSSVFLDPASYQITDITGKIIQTGFLTAEETTIDLSPFQAGLYFLKASNTTIRLVKE